jgi:hypothetical protein
MVQLDQSYCNSCRQRGREPASSAGIMKVVNPNAFTKTSLITETVISKREKFMGIWIFIGLVVLACTYEEVEQKKLRAKLMEAALDKGQKLDPKSLDQV